MKKIFDKKIKIIIIFAILDSRLKTEIMNFYFENSVKKKIWRLVCFLTLPT